MGQEPAQQWSGLAIPKLGTSKESPSLCSCVHEASVCKQPALLKGLAPALPAPGCVPPLALPPLHVSAVLLLPPLRACPLPGINMGELPGVRDIPCVVVFV